MMGGICVQVKEAAGKHFFMSKCFLGPSMQLKGRCSESILCDDTTVQRRRIG